MMAKGFDYKRGQFYATVDGETDTEWMLSQIQDEAKASAEKWGRYRSSHEAYGVLAEEMAELLDAIRADDEQGARYEAMQVAAVAFRFAREGWSRE